MASRKKEPLPVLSLSDFDFKRNLEIVGGVTGSNVSELQVRVDRLKSVLPYLSTVHELFLLARQELLHVISGPRHPDYTRMMLNKTEVLATSRGALAMAMAFADRLMQAAMAEIALTNLHQSPVKKTVKKINRPKPKHGRSPKRAKK